jgi:hypothetical protein
MRMFLPGLCLICMLMAPPALAQKIVLSIDGNWWDSNGQALGFASRIDGPCVFGDAGFLQVADATKKAADTFAYDKMNPACPSSCPARSVSIPPRAHCRDASVTTAIPVAEASVLSGLNLGKLFEVLFRRPQMYIVAAARGLEDEPLEAVLPIDSSEIDMSATLEPLPAATYRWTLEPVDGGSGGPSGKVSWQPSKASKVSAPGVGPGLYRLTTAVEDGESEGSQAWVLLSLPAQYPSDAKTFRQAVELTHSWGDRVDESGKRALLRATLRSLADAGK